MHEIGCVSNTSGHIYDLNVHFLVLFYFPSFNPHANKHEPCRLCFCCCCLCCCVGCLFSVDPDKPWTCNNENIRLKTLKTICNRYIYIYHIYIYHIYIYISYIYIYHIYIYIYIYHIYIYI